MINNFEIKKGNLGGFPDDVQGRYYEIRVKDHLDDSWSDWLEGMALRPMDNGEMVLFGYIADQAALIGLINKLYRLNLTLLSVSEVRQKK